MFNSISMTHFASTIASCLGCHPPALAGTPIPLDCPPINSGSILLDGSDVLKMTSTELETMQGNDVAMIFQDPMTALNPVKTVGDQIAESIELHETISKKDSFKRAKEMLKVDGMSFQIEEDKTLGIVGESGCGKFTTGRAILKLIEHTSGKIVSDGEDITHYRASQMQKTRASQKILCKCNFPNRQKSC